jgi:hypothetical protein
MGAAALLLLNCCCITIDLEGMHPFVNLRGALVEDTLVLYLLQLRHIPAAKQQ